jgi:arginine utilization protein RocB
MVDRIGAEKAQEILAKLSSQHQNHVQPPAKSDADASVQVNYASLIEKAQQAQQADAQALQRAGELLRSGKLDCSAFAWEAAKSIVERGV